MRLWWCKVRRHDVDSGTFSPVSEGYCVKSRTFHEAYLMAQGEILKRYENASDIEIVYLAEYGE